MLAKRSEKGHRRRELEVLRGFQPLRVSLKSHALVSNGSYHASLLLVLFWTEEIQLMFIVGDSGGGVSTKQGKLAERTPAGLKLKTNCRGLRDREEKWARRSSDKTVEVIAA